MIGNLRIGLDDNRRCFINILVITLSVTVGIRSPTSGSVAELGFRQFKTVEIRDCVILNLKMKRKEGLASREFSTTAGIRI